MWAVDRRSNGLGRFGQNVAALGWPETGPTAAGVGRGRRRRCVGSPSARTTGPGAAQHGGSYGGGGDAGFIQARRGGAVEAARASADFRRARPRRSSAGNKVGGGSRVAQEHGEGRGEVLGLGVTFTSPKTMERGGGGSAAPASYCSGLTTFFREREEGKGAAGTEVCMGGRGRSNPAKNAT